MRSLILMIVAFCFVSQSGEARAKAAKKTTKSTAAAKHKTSKKITRVSRLVAPAGKGQTLRPSGRKLSREVVFEGADVNGRYHLAGGAVAKVEQEKKMNTLIGLRGNYKDRLAEERERLKRGEAAETH